MGTTRPRDLNDHKTLQADPSEDTAPLKSVRHSRLTATGGSRLFDPGMAIQILCWFNDESNPESDVGSDPEADAGSGTVVVALLANDKAAIGHVFYECVVRQGGPDDH